MKKLIVGLVTLVKILRQKSSFPFPSPSPLTLFLFFLCYFFLSFLSFLLSFFLNFFIYLGIMINGEEQRQLGWKNYTLLFQLSLIIQVNCIKKLKIIYFKRKISQFCFFLPFFPGRLQLKILKAKSLNTPFEKFKSCQIEVQIGDQEPQEVIYTLI